ncbi:MAG: NAD-dependent epimerase/dehydratase family protein [Phycisphaerales bacterium]|nr:NAD-dependent epimerase/dehydratase family protein [Phycisphaerales bacterium]
MSSAHLSNVSSKDQDLADRRTAVLVTGAGGEMGHGLIRALADRDPDCAIVGLDLRPTEDSIGALCTETLTGDIRDTEMLEELASRYRFGHVFHLAAMLSSNAERAPLLAYEVNVGGTMNLLRLAIAERDRTGQLPVIVLPSTIAVYGLSSLAAKTVAGTITEDEFLEPRTMYGCNKLAAEHLGRYFNDHHGQFESETPGSLDFRSIRFPGIISAETLPSGGTTDYGPEMLHAAARGAAYTCFVRADSQLPFMTMPEAVRAILELTDAPRSSLSRASYNVRSFAPTAAELADAIRTRFTDLDVTFEPTPGRQLIVDGWPADVDDAAARSDWGWAPTHTLDSALDEYLIPGLKAHYGLD